MNGYDSPVPFQGTPEQARENYATHPWVQVDEFEVVCMNCDSKPWHAAAHYPCGEEPPRSQHPALCKMSVMRFTAYISMMQAQAEARDQ